MQCVRHVTPSGKSDAPLRPIARHAATSSACIARARATSLVCRSSGARSATSSASRSICPTAQGRFTAVGLAAESNRPASRIRPRKAPAPPSPRPASVMPYAAEMPIAGAPRTTIARIASATSATPSSRTYRSSCGRRS